MTCSYDLCFERESRGMDGYAEPTVVRSIGRAACAVQAARRWQRVRPWLRSLPLLARHRSAGLANVRQPA